MTRRRSHLLSIEGVTGAGKSTLCRWLRRTWKDQRPLEVLGGYGGRTQTPSSFHRDLLSAIRRQLGRDEFLRLEWSAESLVVQAEVVLAESCLVRPAIARGATV